MSAVAARMIQPVSQAAVAAWTAVVAVVCAVLFLLAIEQRQAVETWHGLRHAVVSLAEGVSATPMSSITVPAPARRWSDFLPTFSSAPSADPGDVVLAGTFRAEGGDADRMSQVTFDGSRLHLASGVTLRTEPLRIYAGRDLAIKGESFARRLEARPDAQIETRRFVPVTGAKAVATLAACRGEPPSSMALLYRQDRVDLMIYRRGAEPGARTPPAAVCGTWTLRAQG